MGVGYSRRLKREQVYTEGWVSLMTKGTSASSIRTSRLLRKNSTDAERILWQYLRAKRMEGVKFRRQQPFGKYIVDFISFSKKLVIEVDGGQHALQKEKDEVREQYIKGEGFRVLRFWNNEVLQNIEGVIEVIGQSIFKGAQ